MTSVLVASPGGDLHCVQLGIAGRAAARLHAHQLDRQLAHGRSPETAASLAWHAQRITDPATCCRLARRYDELAERAALPPTSVPLVPRPDRLRAASAELRAVAERLRLPGPISAAGVASARILLTEAGSTLYRPARPDLQEVLQTILSALNGLPAA